MDTVLNPTPTATPMAPEPLAEVLRIDENQLRTHFDQVVRDSVEQTLNALLGAEADALCNARRYQRSPDRRKEVSANG